MSALHAFLLAALICGSHDPFNDGEHCEQAEIRAASCAAAEAWVRQGLRPGQTLHVIHCGEA